MKTNVTQSTFGHARTCLATVLFVLVPNLVSAQSTFNFGVNSLSVNEFDGSAVLPVVRSGAVDTQVTVDYRTLDGTASSGVRYTATAGTLQFKPGQINLSVVVPILNDSYALGSQFFRVILSNPSSGAALGMGTNAIVRITDNDLGVQFVNSSCVVSEGAGSVQLFIVRIEDGGNPATVDFFTSDLTAKAGIDYVGTSNHLSFDRNETAKAISIPILNNAIQEPTRSFNVTLTNAVGTSLGSSMKMTVSILDDEVGFRFEIGSASVSEDVGTVPMAVLRGTDATNSVVTVDFITMDQTALSGTDYLGVTNTLTFAAGETRKVLAVPILHDGVKKPSRSFLIRLANPGAGSALGSPSAAAVTIVDNDPQLGFEQTSYTTPWGATEIVIPVLRGNDVNLGSLTVDYATADLLAKAGVDYTAVSGTLQFNPNETVKALRVPILANRPSGTRSFRVALSNPVGGIPLGIATANVIIQGSFFTVGPQFSPQFAIQRDSGFNLLSWVGSGQLQRADRPDGPWSTIAGVRSPLPLSSSLPGSFYRIKNPRPVRVFVPASYDGRSAIPLVIALHGFTSSGTDINNYFNLTSYATSKGFLYCYPEGLVLRSGSQDWNCWFDDPLFAAAYSNPWSDDVGFIRGIIQGVAAQFNLDHKRVYLVGHSQGGGMSHFAALHCADLVAAIVSLAGDPAAFYPPPSQPVNILHIHGTADETQSYTDAVYASPPYPPLFPGAIHIGQIWADLNGATGRVTDSAPSLDLDSSLPGLDTVVTRWTNAPPGGAVEVWSILGGHHSPSLSPSFTPTIVDWLLAHPKP